MKLATETQYDDYGREYKQIYWDIGGTKLDFNEYQDLASITAPVDTLENRRDNILNFALGLAGETGETVDYLKKVLFHNHEFDRDTLRKELGDVLWYISQLARMYGMKLDYLAEQNIEKLKKRYPEGFSTERSVNRSE